MYSATESEATPITSARCYTFRALLLKEHQFRCWNDAQCECGSVKLAIFVCKFEIVQKRHVFIWLGRTRLCKYDAYLWISSTICLKFECESLTGDVVETANAVSLANSKLSLEIWSVGIANDIKSVSLDLVWFRFGFRCVVGGGGANEPLLDDVGNDFELPNEVDAELPNEPGRGRVIIDWLDFMLIDDKLLWAKIDECMRSEEKRTNGERETHMWF